MGQETQTLSTGEYGRLRLSKELSKPEGHHTIYIFDEPTAGLHFEDIKKLISILLSLVERGNSVIIIEHNLDIIANADYIIDMGPDAGILGGTIVAKGTKEEIIKEKNSKTAKYLHKYLQT